MKPWLYLPPQLAHNLAPQVLPLVAWWAGSHEIPKWHSLQWRHLQFRNPLGISGGVDKNAANLSDWWQLGAGFVEVGTVTLRPQKPNPGKVFDRDRSRFAIWNKMGFPSGGCEVLKKNLAAFRPYQSPVFVNIGKNRDTANEQAVNDYQKLVMELDALADVFVINVSSPNTAGLRDLQSRIALEGLLRGVRQSSTKPILLKLSPDLTEAALEESLLTAIQCGIDGVILTNTTLHRPPGICFPAEGGMSGLPLKDLSRRALVLARSILNRHSDRNLLLVSAGGVMEPQEVEERLRLGANLVQVYTALVFSGPLFFQKAQRYFQELGSSLAPRQLEGPNES